MKSMSDLLLDHLRDIYYAEKLALKSMVKVIKAAENDEFKSAVQKHGEQTKVQITRLEQVFETMGKKPRAKKCAAMDGLNEEGQEAISEGEKGPVLDCGLLANAQAIEHYEIARYGAMVAWAKSMGLDEAAGLLAETLAEEKETDALLSEIANRVLNPEGASSDAESDDDEEEKGEEDESPEPEPEMKPAPKRRAKAAKPEPEPEPEEEPEPEPEPEPKPAPKRRAKAAAAPAPKAPAPKPSAKKPTRKPAAKK